MAACAQQRLACAVRCLQKEMWERNKPLSDADLDAMMPGEKEGYKVCPHMPCVYVHAHENEIARCALGGWWGRAGVLLPCQLLPWGLGASMLPRSPRIWVCMRTLVRTLVYKCSHAQKDLSPTQDFARTQPTRVCTVRARVCRSWRSRPTTTPSLTPPRS